MGWAGWLITRPSRLFKRLWLNLLRYRRILNVFLKFFDFFLDREFSDDSPVLSDVAPLLSLKMGGPSLFLSPFAQTANTTLVISVKSKSTINIMTMLASWQTKLIKASIETPQCHDLFLFLPPQFLLEFKLTLILLLSLPHGRLSALDFHI